MTGFRGFLVKKKKWIVILTVLLVLGGVALVAAKSKDKDKSDPKAENTPFRLGKVQAEDLQVSVREVGVVDPVTKVDVKSAVSGRVISLKVREGAIVKQGDVLAEIEPDVNQAQLLSDVQASVQGRRAEAPGRRARLHDAEGAVRTGPGRPRRVPLLPDQARPGRRGSPRCADALPDRRGPRHPDLRQRLLSERARRIADGGSRDQEGRRARRDCDLRRLLVQRRHGYLHGRRPEVAHHPRQLERGRHRQGPRRPACARHPRRLSAEDLHRQSHVRRSVGRARREDQGLQDRGHAGRAGRPRSAPA